MIDVSKARLMLDLQANIPEPMRKLRR